MSSYGQVQDNKLVSGCIGSELKSGSRACTILPLNISKITGIKRLLS